MAAPTDAQKNEARKNELKTVLKNTINELVFLECPREEIMLLIKESTLTEKGGKGI